MKVLPFLLVLLECLQSSSADFQVQALVDMKKQLNDYRDVLSDWKDNQMSPCYWDHVTCQDNEITAISLSSSGLSGVLSPSIAKLTTLQQLLLDGHNITGTIPQDFGDLSSLITLNLGRNNLEGSIPNSLAHLSKLQHLLLDENKLSGMIPWDFGDLSSLITLNLGRNILTGPVPNSLAHLSKLQHL
ncbi:unnamed protein product [Urochloa humidicola]